MQPTVNTPGHAEIGKFCGAKKRQSTGTCGHQAGWGTDHVGVGRCRVHGGKTPTQAAGARQQALEQEARKALGRLQFVAVDDPLTALSNLAGEVMAWKETLAGHVAELERLRYSTEGGEQIRGEIVLFERALDRCASVLATIAKLNIDERLVRIEERKADLILAAIDAALAKAGVVGPAAVEARREAARHLRVVNTT